MGTSRLFTGASTTAGFNLTSLHCSSRFPTKAPYRLDWRRLRWLLLLLSSHGASLSDSSQTGASRHLPESLSGSSQRSGSPPSRNMDFEMLPSLAELPPCCWVCASLTV